jgi:hypothetical protein
MERLKKKITAILLIIAFTQKLGLGLFVHAWFHDNTFGLTSDPKSPVTHLQQVRCTCIEDAMVLFTGSTAAILIKTQIKYFLNFSNPLHFFYSSDRTIHYSLRGPPATSNLF